jgi:alanyl-tRNA synthetase
MLSGHQIRKTFLDYFAANGHRVVRSSSLVPIGDPTLLFTNAGMNQFKDVFLGLDQRDYTRATSSQKCVRAGGKHNDLENVGFTNRHHTFFEMLGNFSFGDYFKKDAVAFAWELVTSPKWFGIPVEKLYFTVFGGAEIAPGKALDADQEAAEFWAKTGAPSARVIAVPGLKENFWAMGDTGPCGPCSELHYDMGPAASSLGHTACSFGCECGRYVEIWNLVFMQFNRDAAGAVTPLPKPSIDTGAGLERLAAVLQGKVSNFESDLFRPLMDFAAELCGKSYGAAADSDASLRILADHGRAAAFLISDGVMPSNEGRGYVLRKIIRRAVRHGRMLGLERAFLFQMAEKVAEQMREPYPELLESIGRVTTVIRHEEERFAHTIDAGLRKLDEDLAPLLAEKKGGAAVAYPGEKAFRLYDTFGLPLDFITDVLRDQGIRFDAAEFDRAMEEQRTRAKASWKGAAKEVAKPVFTKIAGTFKTEPDFYFGTKARDCRIEAIVTGGTSVNKVAAGEEAEVVLDRTAIYAESGGQVADTGSFYDPSESMELAEVRGAYYPVPGLVAHRILAKEELGVGDRVAVVADALRREQNKRNHTATHLMHAALRNILGTHVKQAGSLVAPDRLRFDFSHFAPVDPAELADIEQQVNEQIRANAEVKTEVAALDDALASGALAFFGDRYPEQNVRVVTIPDANSPRGFYSKELCGGTHVKRTGDIGVFKIAMEQSVAAGVRRIEALSGEGALADSQRARELLAGVAERLHVGEADVTAALEKLALAQRQVEKQLEAARRSSAMGKLDSLLAQVRTVQSDKGDVRVLAAQVEGVDRAGLRELVNPLRQKMGPGVAVLGLVEDGKIALLSSVTPDLIKRLHAGKIMQAVAKQLEGQGGGRPDLAEGGGKDTSKLKTVLASVYELVEGML